jgi:hypothetical protein
MRLALAPKAVEVEEVVVVEEEVVGDDSSKRRPGRNEAIVNLSCPAR